MTTFDVIQRWKQNGELDAPVGEGRMPLITEVVPARRLSSDRELVLPDTTLTRLLDQSADRFGSADALVYHDTHWTYDELLERVNRLAGGMATMGVRKGDRVLLTLPNCPEFVTSFFAAQKLGAMVVNAGPLMGPDDLVTLKVMTQPKLVVGLDLLAPRLKALSEDDPEMRWLWVTLEGYQPFWKRIGYRAKRWHAHHHNGHLGHDAHMKQMLLQSPSRPPTVEPSPDDVALLQPTGGTTGKMKIAQLTHRNLLSNTVQLSAGIRPMPGQERCLALLPMFHVYGLSTGLIMPIFHASTILPMTRLNLAELFEILEGHRPTITPLAPVVIERVCESLDRKVRPSVIEALRGGVVTSGAAPLTPATSQHYHRLVGTRIVQGYGLTEASPATHINPIDDPRDGSIGKLVPNTRARLADLHDPTRDAEPGEPGELVLSGPQIMQGYLDNPEQTAKALQIDKKGGRWLHTGDVARVDADGYFYIVDRRKDMINRSGLKVYPEKVERVLKLHARIADAAVIGRADDLKTELVVAIVVLEKPTDDTAALSNELRHVCREHLAPYEVPDVFEFIDELPRTALGKLQRAKLREAQAEADVLAGEPDSESEPVRSA